MTWLKTSNGTTGWNVGSYSGIVSGTSTFLTCRNTGGGVYLNGASATSWTAVSDETRKVIIEPITGGLDKVSTLRTVIGRLKTDDESVFDIEYNFEGADMEPMITYGTNPGMGIGISHAIPTGADMESGKASYAKSLSYMGFKEDEPMLGKKIDYVFIGSCTNGRIEDFRAFTEIVKGRKKADNVTAWLVPGSHVVEAQIKEEGLLDILTEAGFVLRQPGCSACLAMNDDKVPAGKYAVSTSNRNFEGRQGPGSRTLLASPIMAAAAAVTGKLTDPRDLL